MRLHEVGNPLVERVTHANLHCMEVVRLWEVAHDTENMSKYVQSLLNMGPRQLDIGCHRVGIADLSILVMILQGVFLVRRDTIPTLVIWTLAPKTDTPLRRI